MTQQNRHSNGLLPGWGHLVLSLIVGLWFSPAAGQLRADDARQQEKPAPVGRFVTLESPLSDSTTALVRRTALELQNLAAREHREAYLVLQLTQGISQFHHVYALADFLTNEPLSGVNTIAWVPESVTGNMALIALACNEIVMHPDASLGDLGRGKALPHDQQTIVRNLIAKRRNRMVNEALAEAMMDPDAILLQLTIDVNGATEKRLVNESEAKRLRDQGVVITDSRTIKEKGTPGDFSAAQARAGDYLAVKTALTRRDVAESYSLPLESLREVRTNGESTTSVAYIQVKDEIDPLLTSFLGRQIDRVIASGTKMIIFEIDSPGGYLASSRDLAFTIAGLSEHDIRTIAYIPDKALSGATIVALGCDEIYLTPSGTMGDAGPIEVGEDGIFQRAEEKVLSFERAMMGDLAERKHRPAAVLMAMADKDLEVYQVTNRKTGRIWYMSPDEIQRSGGEWIQGPRVEESKKGMLLTVRGERAHELKIAEPPVEDLDELKQRLGIPLDMDLNPVKRTWVDDTVWFLNNNAVTGFLFFIAVVCIYVELHTMTGLFGIISVLSFALFFWSRVLGGTAGGLEIILFLLGLGCFAMEIFVVPGFGVFGVSGALLLVASLVMASQTFTGFDLNHDVMGAIRTVGTFGASLAAVIVFALAVGNYLPRIPILREMVLSPPGVGELATTDGPRLRPELEHPTNPLVGEVGTSMTVLRPAGKARVAGRLVDVVSDGPFIAEGRPIKVVRISGNRIVVREQLDA